MSPQGIPPARGCPRGSLGDLQGANHDCGISAFRRAATGSAAVTRLSPVTRTQGQPSGAVFPLPSRQTATGADHAKDVERRIFQATARPGRPWMSRIRGRFQPIRGLPGSETPRSRGSPAVPGCPAYGGLDLANVPRNLVCLRGAIRRWGRCSGPGGCAARRMGMVFVASGSQRETASGEDFFRHLAPVNPAAGIPCGLPWPHWGRRQPIGRSTTGEGGFVQDKVDGMGQADHFPPARWPRLWRRLHSEPPCGDTALPAARTRAASVFPNPRLWGRRTSIGAPP